MNVGLAILLFIVTIAIICFTKSETMLSRNHVMINDPRKIRERLEAPITSFETSSATADIGPRIQDGILYNTKSINSVASLEFATPEIMDVNKTIMTALRDNGEYNLFSD